MAATPKVPSPPDPRVSRVFTRSIGGEGDREGAALTV